MPDYRARNRIIAEICGKSGFVKASAIGKSLCGREISLLEAGRNADILLCGGFHGMEYLTALCLLKFAEELVSVGKNAAIVPCANPDGVEIAVHGKKAAGKYSGLVDSLCQNPKSCWQANARGVDINHNFNAGWKELKRRELELGIISPSPTRFGGNFPESEPETKALVSLCERKNYKLAVALHSQGREIYCQFGGETPESSFHLAEELSKISGYAVSEPEQIAVGGGFKDWFIERFKKPALTIEIGLGKNPLPLSDLGTEYPIVRKMLLKCLEYNI